MGRIVTPLGAGQTFFGRTSRVKLGTGPITTINPIKAIGQGALATAAGVKAIEGVADLTIKGVGAIAKGIAEGKRGAARKALAQDAATQQGQVDTAVSEAGQALESMPGLQPSVGMEQFLQQQGLTSPLAQPGTLFPGELQATDLLERQQQLRTRPGTANVLATQGAPAPEQAAVDSAVERMRVSDLGQAVPISQRMPRFDRRGSAEQQSLLDQQLATGVPISAAQVAADAARRANLRDAPAAPRFNPFRTNPYDAPMSERLDAAIAKERARRELARRRQQALMGDASIAPGLAPSVSPELTQPLRQPFQPTVDLSKLEDLGPLSDRALATYDPGQLMAAAASTRDPAVMERILRAAQGQAQPTSLAELASGEPQRKLDKAIIDQFGKFLPEPEKPLSALDLQRIAESQQRISASKTRQELDDLKRQKLQDAIDRANRPRGSRSRKASKDKQEFLSWVQNGGDFKSKRGSYSDDSILSQGGAGIELGGDLQGSTPTVIKSREDLERYIRSLPAQDQDGVRLEVQSAIDAERNRLYRESQKSFKTYGRFGFDKPGIASARSIAVGSARGKVARGEIKNIAARATDLVTDVDRPGQIEAESFSRETGRLSAQQPIREQAELARLKKQSEENRKAIEEQGENAVRLRAIAKGIQRQYLQAERNLDQVQKEIQAAQGMKVAVRASSATEGQFATVTSKNNTLRALREKRRVYAKQVVSLKGDLDFASLKANQASKKNPIRVE
jgi:hypothetical protein